MPRFFCSDINGDTACISGDDANHISKSLRMKKGEEIILCDTKGTDYRCILQDFSDTITCKIIDKYACHAEPDVFVTLYQSLPKLDKFELIVQKSVELGASRIIPVMSKRCISRPDEKSMAKKIQRWQKIAFEASKQSGRGIIPEIAPLMTFEKAVDNINNDDLSLICYEGGGKLISDIVTKEKKHINVFIGGEGGYDISEVTYAEKKGIVRTGLGNRILRCETAPLAAITLIMSYTENM